MRDLLCPNCECLLIPANNFYPIEGEEELCEWCGYRFFWSANFESGELELEEC